MDNKNMRDRDNANAHVELERFLAGFHGLPTEKLLAGTGYSAGGPNEAEDPDDGPVWLRAGGQHEDDPVNQPAHYQQFGVEVIDIIRYVLGPGGFRAYCIGNELKYRLRAGDKGDASQDLAKAMKYREFREVKA